MTLVHGSSVFTELDARLNADIGDASPAVTDVGKLIQAPLVEKLVEALKFARDEAGRGLDREPTIASLVLIKDRAERALDHVAYTHPAPIKPSADAGELRERVAQIIEAAIERHNPGNSLRHTVDDADAILDLIQSERGAE